MLKLRIEVADSALKFIFPVDPNSPIRSILDSITKILLVRHKNFDISREYQLCTADGYHLLGDFPIGQLVDDNTRVVMSPVPEHNNTSSETAMEISSAPIAVVDASKRRSDSDSSSSDSSSETGTSSSSDSSDSSGSETETDSDSSGNDSAPEEQPAVVERAARQPPSTPINAKNETLLNIVVNNIPCSYPNGDLPFHGHAFTVSDLVLDHNDDNEARNDSNGIRIREHEWSDVYEHNRVLYDNYLATTQAQIEHVQEINYNGGVDVPKHKRKRRRAHTDDAGQHVRFTNDLAIEKSQMRPVYSTQPLSSISEAKEAEIVVFQVLELDTRTFTPQYKQYVGRLLQVGFDGDEPCLEVELVDPKEFALGVNDEKDEVDEDAWQGEGNKFMPRNLLGAALENGEAHEMRRSFKWSELSNPQKLIQRL